MSLLTNNTMSFYKDDLVPVLFDNHECVIAKQFHTAYLQCADSNECCALAKGKILPLICSYWEEKTGKPTTDLVGHTKVCVLFLYSSFII